MTQFLLSLLLTLVATLSLTAQCEIVISSSLTYITQSTQSCDDDSVGILLTLSDPASGAGPYRVRDAQGNTYTGQFGTPLETGLYAFGVDQVVFQLEEPCERTFEINSIWTDHDCEVDVAFILADTVRSCSEPEICLPLRAEGFRDLLGFQFSINYDPALLRYLGTKNELLITPLPAPSVLQVANPSPGNLTFTWNSPYGIGEDLGPIVKLLDLRFEPLQPAISQISFSSTPTVVEVIDGSEQEVIPGFSGAYVEISCAEDECALFAEYSLSSVVNDNGTTRCDDDWVMLTVTATGVGPVSQAYEVLIDGELVAIAPFSTTLNLQSPADGQAHNLTIRDVDDPNCLRTYNLRRRGACRPCMLSVERQQTRYDNNGTPADFTDDLFYVSLTLGSDGNRGDNWVYTNFGGTQLYPYYQEVELPPFSVCEPTVIPIVDELFPDCELIIDLSQTFSVTLLSRTVDQNGTVNLCVDDSVYYNIRVSNATEEEAFEWFAVDNFDTLFSGSAGVYQIGPYPISATIDRIELDLRSNTGTDCLSLLLEDNFPVCRTDLSLEASQVSYVNPFRLELQLTNSSNTPATNVTVHAPLPSRVNFVSSDGNYDPDSGLWQVDSLASWSDTTLRISVVASTMPGDSLLLAEVIGVDQFDWDSTPGNGVDTDGDGQVADDAGDEDDGDGLIICTIIADTLNVSADTLCAGQSFAWSLGDEQLVPPGYGAFVGVYASVFSQADEAILWADNGVLEQASLASNTSYWLRTVVAPISQANTPVFDEGCIALGPFQAVFWQQPVVGNCTETELTCAQPSVTLGCNVSGQAPMTYRWFKEGVFVSLDPELTIVEGGAYTLDVVDAVGCLVRKDLFVTEDLEPLDVNILIGDGNLCSADNPLQLFASTSSGGNTYAWSNGATTRSIVVNEAGTYRVSVTNQRTMCQGTAEITITDIPEACNELSGFVRRSENCETGEDGLGGWLVIASGSGYARATYSRTDGAYDFDLPVGDYQVRLIAPSTAWDVCEFTYNINFSGYGEQQVLDLLALEAESCPLLFVDITLPAFRPCRSDRSISVYYRNVGTDTLYNGLLAIILPPELTLVGTNGDLLEERGDTLFFAAESPLPPGAAGRFWVRPEVSCQAEVGRTLCVRALGLPYGPCPSPVSTWSGASLQVDGYCEGEELRFEVRNVGDESMQERGQYIVIQDIVMLMEAADTFDPLGPGESVDFNFPANGTTYRMEVEQAMDHPGFSQPSVSVEGCGTDEGGTVSTGIITQFPFDDHDYYVDEDCRIVTNAYDPNDKQAEPRGYAEPHYIQVDQKLEYTIRFQNTGTDTAFQVVIRDTLSNWLDLSTFRSGASSHPYRIALDSAQQIAFVFDDILLPDSTTNEEASQGFVSFQIHPVPGIPLETVVRNQAAIYFDFNPPIFTNATFHTVGRNFLRIVSWEHIQPYTVDWRYYPNPGSTNLSVEIKGEVDWPILLRLQPLSGQAAYTYTLGSPATQLQLGELPTGYYVVSLHDDNGRVLGQGKWVKLE